MNRQIKMMTAMALFSTLGAYAMIQRESIKAKRTLSSVEQSYDKTTCEFKASYRLAKPFTLVKKTFSLEELSAINANGETGYYFDIGGVGGINFSYEKYNFIMASELEEIGPIETKKDTLLPLKMNLQVETAVKYKGDFRNADSFGLECR